MIKNPSPRWKRKSNESIFDEKSIFIKPTISLPMQYIIHIGLGAPSSNDPKFEQRPPGAPWSTFHKSNDAKFFLLSILKGLERLETFRSGLVGLSLIIRKTGASGRF
jgi:hypothetical protein